ncbi:DUF6677 family protein [Saccharibacillus kuerlensis]|uniref:DUF6677 domain-containing protein n=1 Tax=Saccharibacillus kuerlensis TaxID=459527 RepID=A0ABQ2L5B9_9BACL|nr:DUF6677 family protein [Saccharibacillus kuerlensis]GGO04140.1 hypothetical protein GCM10010969_29130 [Saccharibacillus kuerlensis]
MNQQRSRVAALLLNMVPGLGHLYWGNKKRSFIYFLLIAGLFVGGVFLTIVTDEDSFVIIGTLGAIFLWFISMMDMVVVLLSSPSKRDEERHYAREEAYRRYREYERNVMREDQGMEPGMKFDRGGEPDYPPYPPIGEGRMIRDPEYFSDSERFYTVILSFVPGLGHLYMGLLQRGVSFLAAFFGLATALVFMTGFTGQESFLLFLGVLPIIWIYGMFDAVQLAGRKSQGEKIRDYSLIEKWDMGREGSSKSRTLGLLLAIVPGASHMYLGLMKRGAQMMILFFGSIYILDVLGLSLFLFLVPLIWFYAFFDALQQNGRYGHEPLVDTPLLQNFSTNRVWIGILLVVLGVYYVLKTIVMPLIDLHMSSYWSWLFYETEPYVRNAIVALLLIGGGLKMLRSGKKESV